MKKEGLSFFRCTLCSAVVSVWDIKDGGCQKCGSHRIAETNLTLWEKIVQLLKHPFFWLWPDDSEWKVSTLHQSIEEKNRVRANEG